MLWMKGWLETKWRFLYVLCLPLLAVALWVRAGLHSAKQASVVAGVLSFFFVFAAVYLAGSGIRTQAALRATRGLHESTFFTLSLPVSRLRLLAIRMGVGMAATAVVIVIVICTMWLTLPVMRGDSAPVDLLKLVVAAIVCSACFHHVSVALSTFLDDLWQTSASVFAICAVWWAVDKLSLPPSLNVFSFLGAASPLVTHRLPWPAMAISVVASAILFLAALKVVQNREY